MIKPYSLRERGNAVGMMFNGASPRQVSDETGIGEKTLRKWARAAGVKPARPTYSQKFRDAVAVWYKEGYSPAELSRRCEVPISTITRWLRSAGLREFKKAPAYRRYSPCEKAEIIKKMRDGVLLKDITAVHGVKSKTLKKWRDGEPLWVFKAGGRDRVLNAAQRYWDGESRDIIAAEFNISPSAFSKWVGRVARGMV